MKRRADRHRGRGTLAVASLAAALLAGPAAQAQAYSVNGAAHGYYDGFGSQAWVEVVLGTGGPVYVPGAVADADRGTGVARIRISGPMRVDTHVVISHARVGFEGEVPVFDARGIGSDGACYGVRIATYHDSAWLGLARGPASAIDEDTGPCVAKPVEYVLGRFTIATLG